MVPKLELKLFPVVFGSFQSFFLVPSYSPALLDPLFPGVPALSVVIYVVKNASRLGSVAELRAGSVSRFSLSVL